MSGMSSKVHFWASHVSLLGWSSIEYPPENKSISSTSRHFWVDDFPFPQVGYVSSLEIMARQPTPPDVPPSEIRV